MREAWLELSKIVADKELRKAIMMVAIVLVFALVAAIVFVRVISIVIRFWVSFGG